MLVPPPSLMPSMVFRICSRRAPTGPSGISTFASLEKVTSEKSSPAPSRSTRVAAAFLALTIASPPMEPLTSSTRCTDRWGLAAGALLVERSARRVWKFPPAGGSLARSWSVEMARVLAAGAGESEA